MKLSMQIDVVAEKKQLRIMYRYISTITTQVLQLKYFESAGQ